MNEYVNVRVGKNGFVIDRMYRPKSSAYMVTETLVAKTQKEALKIVGETLKLINGD